MLVVDSVVSFIFAGEEIQNFQDFINVVSKLCKGGRVPLEYISYTNRHRRKSVLVTVNRHEWYASHQIYTRDDNSGLWIGKQALPPGCNFLSCVTKVNGVLETVNNVSEQLVNGVKTKDGSDTGVKKQRVGEELIVI